MPNPRPFARLRLILAALLLALVVQPAAAQLSTAPAPAADPQAAAPGAETDALIRLLRDPEAREALIRQLESAEGAPAANAAATAETGEPAPAPEATETPVDDAAEAVADAVAPAAEPALPAPSFGRTVAEATQAAAESLAGAAIGLWSSVSAAPDRLDDLSGAVDLEVILGAVQELAIAILVTYAVFILLRLAARPLRVRLDVAGAEAGWLRTLLLSLAVAALDALVVLLAWAAGYAIVTFALGSAGSIGIRQTLYLNAFVAVEITRIIVRLLLRPNSDSLRLIPIPNAGATYIYSRLMLAAGILGYGQLLAVPIVNAEAGWRAGQALGTALSLTAVLIGMIAVMRHRRQVAHWLTPDEPESRRFFVRLARLWHIPVMIYLACLFVIVLARPGDVLWPVLEASGKIVAAIVVGMIVNNLLGRRARAGIHLPRRWNESMPLLERRINGFIPKALLVLRIVVVIAVTAAALHVAGVIDLDTWLESETGLQITGGFVSVALILLGAFLVWLAFSSWIDWRLNPEVGRAPTSRETTLLSLLRNAATIALGIITLMFALSEIGIDIAPLIASAGVLGLAIGFGAQKLVQDVITGVFIQLDNAMNVGDVVTAASITGVVEKLTIRSVSLRALDGTYHLIPFSSVDAVSNLTRDFSYFVADMGVAYREDVDDVKQAMHDAFDELRANPDFGAQITGPFEWFGLNALGDSAVVLRGRIKTLPGKQWGIGRAYNEICKRIFDARGIEIPFPHQTIYFGENKDGSAPPLHLVREPKLVEGEATPAPAARITADTDPATQPESGGTVHRDMPDDDDR